MIYQIAAVAVGGALGSVARFLAGQTVASAWPRHSYLGTLTINLLGCFAIGYLAAFFLTRADLPLALRSGLIVGVLGGFTTFSSFSLDSLRLLESGRLFEALSYLALSVGGGLLACWAGLQLAKICH